MNYSRLYITYEMTTVLWILPDFPLLASLLTHLETFGFKFRKFNTNGCCSFTSAQNEPVFIFTAHIDVTIIQQIDLYLPISN